MENKVYYIMGVSGSGKTTIGKLLSSETGYPFYDADDFHSPENVQKMKDGVPLTDEDRMPWLQNIHAFVTGVLQVNSLIFVCSALKESYREILEKSLESQCKWIFLDGSPEIIQQRLGHRIGHYMPPTLLQSQFDALERPANALVVDIRDSPGKIVAFLKAALG